MPATFPIAFSTALAQPGITVNLWMEIEGLPWAFGDVARDAFWFTARLAAFQRLGVLPLLAGVPAGVEQESRPTEGTCSTGRLTVRVVDDGAGHALDLIGHSARRDKALALAADMAIGTTTITSLVTTGTVDAAAYPTGGGIFYCGRETFTYASRSGNTFSGVERAQFRIEGQGADNAHTAGDWITPYPRFVKTRKATFYITLDGSETAKVLRFYGTVSDVRAASSTAAFDIDADSLDSDLGASIFAGQIRGKLSAGVKDATGAYDGAGIALSGDVHESPGLVLRLDASTVSGRSWVEGQRVVVRVGDEYVSGVTRVGGGFDWEIHALAPDGGRGCFNSEVQAHAPGDEVIEVMVLAGRDASGPPEFRAPYFTGGHPLTIAMQLALSRKGDGANGGLDVLPFGGIGLDAALLDLAGISTLRDRWLPGFTHVQVVEERTTFAEWLATMLRPLVCYPASRANGQITIRRVGPSEVATLPTVSTSSISEIPLWQANLGTVVGRVVLLADYDPNASGQRGPWRSVFLGEMVGPGTEAQEFYRTSFEEKSIEAPGCWTGIPAAPGIFGAGRDTGAELLAYRIFDTYRDRYARPWPMIEVALLIDRLDIEVGDLVQLSIDNLPDVSSGLRGIAGAVCEVLHRTPDEARGIVVLTLQQTAYPAVGTRLLAPDATVAHSYYPNPYIDITETVQPFPVGAIIEVWSSDLRTLRGTATMTVWQPPSTLWAVPAISGVVAGDVILLASYTSHPADVRAKYAFMSGPSGLSTGAEPHIYAP